MEIERLLQRRTDLSTFLVHLTRSAGGVDRRSARSNLESIIETGSIRANSAYGPARRLESYLADSESSQKVACFTETPLEHIWMMLEDIEGRSVQFAPYGLAITKTTGRKAGLNPVWYSDITRRGPDWPATSVNRLVEDALARAKTEEGSVDEALLRKEPIFQITPFFEQMGPTSTGRKEFWWEREWRKIGNVSVFPRRVVAVLAPEGEHDEIETFLATQGERWADRPLLDPCWGLERMIVKMANVPDDHVGPFPDA